MKGEQLFQSWENGLRHTHFGKLKQILISWPQYACVGKTELRKMWAGEWELETRVRRYPWLHGTSAPLMYCSGRPLGNVGNSDRVRALSCTSCPQAPHPCWFRDQPSTFYCRPQTASQTFMVIFTELPDLPHSWNQVTPHNVWQTETSFQTVHVSLAEGHTVLHKGSGASVNWGDPFTWNITLALKCLVFEEGVF